jgi:uncharacterized protein (TIGR02001 family)
MSEYLSSVSPKAIAAAALLALSSLCAAQPALADDDWGTFSASVAGQSDYRFRGISQNNGEFTPEGSVNWAGPEGFYAGTWIAKTDWIGTGNNPSYEVDFYGGKHFDLWGTDLNVEAYYYSYPDAKFPGVSASYYETIVQLTHAFGPLSLQVTGSNSPDWSLHAGSAWNFSGNATFTVADWLTISGNGGHQEVNHNLPSYTYYDFGATATYKSFSLDVRYVGTDLSTAQCGLWIGTSGTDPGAPCSGTGIVTLTYNIPSFPW